LEMNTRLQVEHPVTEMVTGIDLVEKMIRIAAGEKLKLAQADVAMTGWALEARVYAEDPARGFLPSTGRLVRYRGPPPSPAVRVDSGVYEGAEIPVHYDPMIAKLITHGVDRVRATAAMRGALDAFHIRGVANNIAFLSAVFAHPRFVAGRLSTGFIEEEFPRGFSGVIPDPEQASLVIAVAAVIHHRYQAREALISGRLHPASSPASGQWIVVMGGEHHSV